MDARKTFMFAIIAIFFSLIAMGLSQGTSTTGNNTTNIYYNNTTGTSNHAILTNLNWSVANHTIDTDIDFNNHNIYSTYGNINNYVLISDPLDGGKLVINSNYADYSYLSQISQLPESILLSIGDEISNQFEFTAGGLKIIGNGIDSSGGLNMNGNNITDISYINMQTAGKGITMVSPNGNKWCTTVSNTGVLTTVSGVCV